MVRIPSEYQEVEYIESTGTQWINTSIAPLNLDFEILVDYVWLPLNENNWTSPFGARLNSSNNRADYIFRNGEGYYGKGYQSVKSLTNIKNDSNRNLVSLSRNAAFRNGINDASTKFNNTYAINYSIYLFSTNNSNSAVNNFFGKIYSAYIKIEDNYTFYGVPCYRKSDNEIGMYDTVTKTFFTNQGTGTFLKGNDVNYDTVNLIESRRRILLNTPHLESLTGSTLSFKTDMASKLKECKIHFTPIQEGTGDPSPDNVRPIVGWDGIEVTRCGKNLIPSLSDTDFWERNAYINRWGSVIDSSRYKMCDYKPALPNKDYRFTNASYTWVGIGFYDSSYAPLNFIEHNGGKVSLISPNDAKYYRLYAKVNAYDLYLETSDSVDNHVDYPTSSFTAYEPYTATTLTIPFPQTIYGGYVDLVKGEVVEEWAKVTFDGSDSKINRGGYYFSALDCFGAAMVYAQPYAENIGDNVLCDKLKTYGNYMSSDYLPYLFAKPTSRLYLCFVCGKMSEHPEITTDTQRITFVNDWLNNNPVTVCYPLKTPNTYPLDPVAIRTLRGMNDIWSDANGNIEIKYWTH